jgi:hypothetical protein
MFETFKGKIAFSGVTVLAIGVTLLIFTFASAYSFLAGDLQVLSTQDLAQTFGDSLAPLIGASIRIMYLGVMGWVGSLITIRGVTIIANAPKAEIPDTQKLPETKTPQKTQPKLQLQKPTKPVDLKLSMIPLDEMEQQYTPKPKTK